MQPSGIYTITNKLDGKQYVGSAVSLTRRKTEHLGKLARNKHVNGKLQNAWNKYGADNFEFAVIEYVIDRQLLLEREQYWLDTLEVVDRGYNITRSASAPMLGRKHTAEAIAKIISYSTGRLHTEESKQRISASNIGKIVSETSRLKQSATRKISPAAQAHIKVLNASKIGTKHSAETILKMRENKVGKTHSPETIAKMKAVPKRPMSIETKAKLSALKRARDAQNKLNKGIKHE